MFAFFQSQKPDPETKEPIEGVGLKVTAVNPHSGTSDPSSSRAILTTNGPNGSENPPNMSNVYAALQKQLERTDKVLDLFQNQAKSLQHHGESMKTQAAALRVQGEALKTQGDVLKEQQGTLKGQDDLLKIQGTFILGLIHNQGVLKQENERLKKEILRHGSILQKQEMKLKTIEGRLDKLLKGHPDNGNPAGAPPTCGGELDLKPPESNGLVLVPLTFSTVSTS